MNAAAAFRRYVSGIKKGERVAILWHPDGDGLCAAVIAAKALARLGRPAALIFTQKAWQISLTPRTRQLLKRRRIDRLLILDMAADQCPSSVKETEQIARLLIIDHHRMCADVSSQRTALIKAESVAAMPGDRYPAAKLTYDLFSQVVDISDLDWIAAVGIFADKAAHSWKAFLRATANRYAVNVRRFDEAEELLDCARCMPGKMAKTFEIFHAAAGLKDVLTNPLLRKWQALVTGEVAYYIKKCRQLAEFYPAAQLIWYEISPRYNIKSKLANDLSLEWPRRTIIVLTKNARADVSARRQDRAVPMCELLCRAIEGIPRAVAGGHVPAAGGILPTKYLPQFKEKVLTYAERAIKKS